MARRFFERLQKGAEGRIAEHMNFIDDEDFMPVARRLIPGLLNQLSYVIHARIRSRIDLDDIDTVPCCYFRAGRAAPAGFTGFALVTIQRFGQDPRGRGFTASPRTGEKKRMRDTTTLESIEQCSGDMILPNNLLEVLRTPFAS